MRQLDISDLADLSRQHADAREGVKRAIERLEEIMMDAAAWRKRSKNTVEYYRLRRDLPYCMHKTELEGVRVLVNRNYKPIGSTSDEFLKYEDYVNSHIKLTPEQIVEIVSGHNDGYLFNDGDMPWEGAREARAYLKRLRQFLQYL